MQPCLAVGRHIQPRFVAMGGVCLVILAAAGCRDGPPTPASEQPATSDEPPSDPTAPRAATELPVAEARMLTASFQKALKGELMKAIGAGGPAAAIDVCNVKAPRISDEVLNDGEWEGWTIGRTASRIRNPANAPNAWQRRGLAALEKTAGPREASEPVEWHEVTDDGHLRYMRAIWLAPLCTTCHGDPGNLSPEVTEKLRELYPHDQATGYSAGELRGAFVVTAPLR